MIPLIMCLIDVQSFFTGAAITWNPAAHIYLSLTFYISRRSKFERRGDKIIKRCTFHIIRIRINVHWTIDLYFNKKFHSAKYLTFRDILKPIVNKRMVPDTKIKSKRKEITFYHLKPYFLFFKYAWFWLISRTSEKCKFFGSKKIATIYLSF